MKLFFLSKQIFVEFIDHENKTQSRLASFLRKVILQNNFSFLSALIQVLIETSNNLLIIISRYHRV